MSFAMLAVVSLAGILGPLLALPGRWRLPVVLGELLAGIALGPTGAGSLHADEPTFAFLANVGFALVMFVAGSHVPVRDKGMRAALGVGLLRAAAVGAVAVPVGLLLSRLFGTGHAALYAVLLASSSAALVLPIVDSLTVTGPAVLAMLPQVAVADTACIVALPLAIDPRHAVRAGLGAVVVAASAALLFLGLRRLETAGLRRRLHRVSEDRNLAMELRLSLTLVFALSALAVRAQVSILLAGFSFGLVVAGIGEPRRLARQLFALTEGFLGPLFFVWLGTSLDLRDLGRHPAFIGLGVALGCGAIGTHTLMRVSGQPVALGALASAQLGVPVAAATLGARSHLLAPGEPAALLVGAMVTIAAAVLGGRAVAGSQAAGSAAATASGGEPASGPPGT